MTVLQIRWGKRDNLGMIFHMIHLKCMISLSAGRSFATLSEFQGELLVIISISL